MGNRREQYTDGAGKSALTKFETFRHIAVWRQPFE